MEEKKEKIDSKNNQEEWDNHISRIAMRMSEQTSLSLHLPTRIESPKGTSMGRFWQAINKARGLVLVRKKEHLLDIAVSHSRFLSRAKKEAHKYKIFPSGETSLVVTHRIFSEFNEEYTVATVLQEKQTVHLRLQLSWCSETLIVRMAAPRGLWTILALEEYGMNYFLLPIILS